MEYKRDRYWIGVLRNSMKIKSSLSESDNVEFNLSLLKKRNDKRFIHFEVLSIKILFDRQENYPNRLMHKTLVVDQSLEERLLISFGLISTEM